MDAVQRVTFRDATAADAKTVTRMIRLMVTDMAGYGGYPVATDAAAWDTLNVGFERDLRDAKHRFILAALGGQSIGLAGAELITIAGAFAPLVSLHVSVLYVVPDHRRSGIAGQMLQTLLVWGRQNGAVQSDLNVLANNPARSLYEKCGFSDFQITMVSKL